MSKAQRILVIVMALVAMGFMAFNAVLGPIARQIGVAEWQVGVIVTASGVLWMLSSRPWGHLGDRLGAHRVMQYGLMGYSLSFLLLVIIVMGSLAQWWTALAAFVLLLVVRSTVSLFYSGLPTMTQAYVAQTTTRETRAAGMATLGMGSALGLIFGPASAALLARWSLALPVVFSASVGVLAWWLVAKHLPTLAQRPSAEIPVLALTDKRIRVGCISAFLTMFCIVTAQVNTGFLVQDLFHLDTRSAASMAGMMLLCVGIALLVSQALVRKLKPLPMHMLIMGCMVAGCGFAATPFATTPWLLGMVYFASGLGFGFVFPGFQSLTSLNVTEAEQGSAAGTLSAAQALGMVVAPLLTTWLYHVHLALPYVFAGIMMLLWALWLCYIAKSSTAD